MLRLKQSARLFHFQRLESSLIASTSSSTWGAPWWLPESPLWRALTRSLYPIELWRIIGGFSTRTTASSLIKPSFYSRTFRQTLTPREIVDKTLAYSDELRYYDNLYQLLLLHFQEKQTAEFFERIADNLNLVNHHLSTSLTLLFMNKEYFWTWVP